MRMKKGKKGDRRTFRKNGREEYRGRKKGQKKRGWRQRALEAQDGEEWRPGTPWR